jgi:hypothetical protein
MRRSRLLLAAAWALLAIGMGWGAASAQALAIVRGDVTNGTEGASVAEGLAVTVRVFVGQELADARILPVGVDGMFSVDDLELAGEETLVAEVAYQGVAYASERVFFDGEQDEVVLDVTVYESSAEPVGVAAMPWHIFVVTEGDRLRVDESLNITNSGDWTFVGRGAGQTLVYTLPGGFSDLAFDGPVTAARHVELQQGFADTRPLRPGDPPVNLGFRYYVAYQPDTPFRRENNVGATSVAVFVDDPRVAVEGDGFSHQGEVDTAAGPMRTYLHELVAAGEPLVFRLVPREEPAAGAGAAMADRSGLFVGAAGLACGLGVAALIWWWPASAPVFVRPLIAELAELDAAAGAGTMPEAAYRQQREALEAQAREALLRR